MPIVYVGVMSIDITTQSMQSGFQQSVHICVSFRARTALQGGLQQYQQTGSCVGLADAQLPATRGALMLLPPRRPVPLPPVPLLLEPLCIVVSIVDEWCLKGRVVA